MNKFAIFAVCVFAPAVLSGCGESSASGPGAGGSAGSAGSAGASSGGTSSGGASGGSAGSGNPGGSGGVAGGAGGSAGVGGQAPSGRPFVYVGGTDGSISIYNLDTAAKTLTFSEAVDAGDYPSFLATTSDAGLLFAVNEATAEVASFQINIATGGLTFSSRVDSGGGSPAHVSVSGGHVMVANYGGGNVRVLPIGLDGVLGAPIDTEDVGINPHMIITDAANQFAFVPTKGSDMIAQFTFSAGQLTPNAVPQVMTADGAGPRHIAFSPNGDFAYVINELDSTMNAYSYDEVQGQLTEIDSESTLPPGFNGQNTCAHVVVAPSGQFLYGSNRGHDSIVIYAIGADGELTYVANDDSGGSTPRNFTVDSTGTVMLVANRDTSNVVVFSIDPTTGRISNESEVSVEEPEYVGIVMLPPM